jgi:hypothetical protein
VELVYLSAIGWKVINKTPPPSTAFTHYIGEQFGGGVVVAVWKTSGVEHGLIISPTDIGTSAYSNVSTVIIGTAAQSRSNGQGNTTAIINQPGHTSSAAKLCDDYVNGGFTDWYLPAS